MRFVSISEAKDHLPELIRMAGREAIILTRSGHPCAKLESVDEEDLQEEALYRNPKFLDWLENARRSSLREKGVDARTYLKKLKRKKK